MNQNSSSSRLKFTLAVTGFALAHLSIELLTGGVRVHYPLQQEDMPALSNWWGLVLLPALAWFSYTHMSKDSSTDGLLGLEKAVIFRLIGAFIYGAALGASFEFGLGQTPLYLLFALLLGGVFYPLYRLEIVLGCVLGMTYTFGAVIPTVVLTLVALFSLITYNTVRFIVGKLRNSYSR